MLLGPWQRRTHRVSSIPTVKGNGWGRKELWGHWWHRLLNTDSYAVTYLLPLFHTEQHTSAPLCSVGLYRLLPVVTAPWQRLPRTRTTPARPSSFPSIAPDMVYVAADDRYSIRLTVNSPNTAAGRNSDKYNICFRNVWGSPTCRPALKDDINFWIEIGQFSSDRVTLVLANSYCMAGVSHGWLGSLQQHDAADVQTLDGLVSGTMLKQQMTELKTDRKSNLD